MLMSSTLNTLHLYLHCLSDHGDVHPDKSRFHPFMGMCMNQSLGDLSVEENLIQILSIPAIYWEYQKNIIQLTTAI